MIIHFIGASGQDKQEYRCDMRRVIGGNHEFRHVRIHHLPLPMMGIIRRYRCAVHHHYYCPGKRAKHSVYADSWSACANHPRGTVQMSPEPIYAIGTKTFITLTMWTTLVSLVTRTMSMSVVAQQIKTHYHYNHQQMSTIATWKIPSNKFATKLIQDTISHGIPLRVVQTCFLHWWTVQGQCHWATMRAGKPYPHAYIHMNQS